MRWFETLPKVDKDLIMQTLHMLSSNSSDLAEIKLSTGEYLELRRTGIAIQAF